MKSPFELHLIGMPLCEELPMPPHSREALEKAEVWICENRRVALPAFKRVQLTPPAEGLFFLDPFRDSTWQEIKQAVLRLAKKGGTIALLSDTGMPVLFDPGREVLELCRNLGAVIRSASVATSWSTACCLSGFAPPFLIEGFLPIPNPKRLQRLKELRALRVNTLLMDTPYRFEALLEQTQKIYGKNHPAFLCWDLEHSTEKILWGTLLEISQTAQAQGMKKGEFILLLKA